MCCVANVTLCGENELKLLMSVARSEDAIYNAIVNKFGGMVAELADPWAVGGW